MRQSWGEWRNDGADQSTGPAFHHSPPTTLHHSLFHAIHRHSILVRVPPRWNRGHGCSVMVVICIGSLPHRAFLLLIFAGAGSCILSSGILTPCVASVRRVHLLSKTPTYRTHHYKRGMSRRRHTTYEYDRLLSIFPSHALALPLQQSHRLHSCSHG